MTKRIIALLLLVVVLLPCCGLTACDKADRTLNSFSQLSGYDFTITRAEYNYFSDGGRLNTVNINSMDYEDVVTELQSIVCVSQGNDKIDDLNDFLTIWDDDGTKWTVSLTYIHDYDTGYYYSLTNSDKLLEILSKYL